MVLPPFSAPDLFGAAKITTREMRVRSCLSLRRAPSTARSIILGLGLLISLLPAPVRAQKDVSGEAQMRLMLDELNNLGSVMMIAAHPDDENTALLAHLARGRHVRTAYLSLTRGEGGQNLIGSEQGDELDKGVIENALKKAFAPEFLNRIDDVVMFNSLTRENIHKIIDIELGHLFGRVNGLGYTIKITDAAKDYIEEKGYDPQYGARPLKRAIQKYVEDPLAEEIIKTPISEGDVINIDYDKVKNEMVVGISKAKEPKARKKKDEPKDEQ